MAVDRGEAVEPSDDRLTVDGGDAYPALALDGGQPVHGGEWPAWPRVTDRSERMLIGALRSGRWTVSGAYTGERSCERRFADAFADFHGVAHCVPTSSGSSALTVALEALDVGPGMEVVVPGLTWVACASAVAGVGAVPVLADVEAETLCASPEAVERAISPRTAAIMLVHLFCSSVDLDRFVALSQRHGIPLIEDCSQAHGAVWRGRRVGSFGTVAPFSFQQTKLLTSGEGGAVLTSDSELAGRMQELRADGRRYGASPRAGWLELEEVGAVQGHNHCLSEFHAALLLEGLERLDEENRLRRENVAHLERLLPAVGGVKVVERPPELEAPAYYHLCLRFDPSEFGDASAERVAAAMSEELGLLVEPVDRPLNANPLYDPRRSSRTGPGPGEALDPSRFELPVATEARRTCITIPHRALLGTAGDMADIVEALDKVRHHSNLHRVAASRT